MMKASPLKFEGGRGVKFWLYPRLRLKRKGSEMSRKFEKSLVAATVVLGSSVWAFDVHAGSTYGYGSVQHDGYENVGRNSNASGRVNYYRQGGSSTGYSESFYSSHNKRPRYARRGLEGSAQYTGPGTFYNQQSMNYYSASSKGVPLEVEEVTSGASAEKNRNHPDYYRQFWRSRLR